MDAAKLCKAIRSNIKLQSADGVAMGRGLGGIQRWFADTLQDRQRRYGQKGFGKPLKVTCRSGQWRIGQVETLAPRWIDRARFGPDHRATQRDTAKLQRSHQPASACRTSARSGFGFARGGRLHRGEQECNAEVSRYPRRRWLFWNATRRL
jgi:hypothetical protein